MPCNFVIAGCLILFLTSPFFSAADLKRTTVSELETLAKQEPPPRVWDPRFWEILIPEKYVSEAKVNPEARLPAPVKEHALSWTRKVVRAEYLPTNLDQLLVGVRDINLDEKGLIPTGYTADFVLAAYEMQGLRFQVIESGLTFSFRVEMPAGVEIRDDQQSVGDALKRFLNLEPSIFDAPYWTTVWLSPLFYGFLEPDEPRRDSKGRLLFEWWENVAFASDGSFLFASIREVRDGVWKNVTIDWQPVPPDRF